MEDGLQSSRREIIELDIFWIWSVYLLDSLDTGSECVLDSFSKR